MAGSLIDGINSQSLNLLPALSHQAVKKWLAPCDPYPVFRTSLSTFQKGTGKWFLDDVLPDWLDGRWQQILWLRAKRA